VPKVGFAPFGNPHFVQSAVANYSKQKEDEKRLFPGVFHPLFMSQPANKRC
jgi:hypothetical protein